MVADFEAALAFYQNLLGFRISDYMRAPKICFLHVNARHHSLALFERSRQGMHHLLVELYSLDDVGQGYDIARAQADQVKVSLGRHNNDYITSFYMQTPSNFLIEYGWGGREVDVATWQPTEMSTGASFWGHEGLRQSTVGDAPPPAHLPPEGRRAPLQVMDGNYERLKGVCPWWDAMIAGR
jgi:catechol 2,3-dioxygenase-like lactoylglutathione lyase family enzyme